MVYEFIVARREAASEKPEVVPVPRDITIEARSTDRTDATGSIGPDAHTAALLPRPRPLLSYDTLIAADRHPAWRQPDLRQEAQLRHPSN
jgi:hypothetical protein